MTEICNEPYYRTGVELHCTFPAGHSVRDPQDGQTVHSWQWLKNEDEAKQAECDDLPTDVEALIEAIAAGHADDYLETILAACHGRKRAKRGIDMPYGRRERRERRRD